MNHPHAGDSTETQDAPLPPSHHRPLIIGICPACAGLGQVPYNGDWGDAETPMVTCDRCEGDGDLDAYRLTEVWRMGYEAGLHDARSALTEVRACLDQGMNFTEQAKPIPPASVLRARLGG